MRHRFGLTALAFACGLLLAGAAQAEKVIERHHLDNDDPFDNATGAMARVFKTLVESGTNGAIRVQTFPNGQLGKDAEVVSQIKAGVVESGIHSVGGFASVYPMIGVLDMPFAFPHISVTCEVFDGPFGKKLAADIEAKTGLVVLGFDDSGGFFALTNSGGLARSPADTEAFGIRTMGLDTHERPISAIGGQPAATSWAEVRTALQTEVDDGQMNPIPIVAFTKFDEVQKDLTLTNHLFAPYMGGS